jgi:hypothetical protein
VSRSAAATCGVLLATVLNAVGVFTEVEIHWVNLAVGFGLALLWTAVVFGIVARLAERTANRAAWTGCVCGVLGVLTVVAFWSALPPVLGAAAVYLGLVGRNGRRWLGAGAVVLGVAAIVLDVGAYATDVASRF